MNGDSWAVTYRELFERGVKRYGAGERGRDKVFTSKDGEFLATIGATLQETYDFVEDLVKYGEPSYETALLITAVRRDYFLVVQKGVLSTNVVSMDSLPPKAQEVEGIAWLPRLIVKARVKLRGEMPDDLMYGCGGDRPFAARMNFELPDFLRVVWACGDDDARIIRFVKEAAKSGGVAGFKTLQIK